MKILGTGSALPKKVVTNDDLAAFLDTNDEWISTRTGIRERRVLSEETLQSLAEAAGKAALENARVAPEEIDFVLVTTVQAETLSPALACDIQTALGLKCMGLDLNGGCTGFIAALSVAEGLIAAGRAHKVLIVSAEALSRFADWTDRSTCVLFGDAAAAVVVRAGGVSPLWCRLRTIPNVAALDVPGVAGTSPFDPAASTAPASALSMRGRSVDATSSPAPKPTRATSWPASSRPARASPSRASGMHALETLPVCARFSTTRAGSSPRRSTTASTILSFA